MYEAENVKLLQSHHFPIGTEETHETSAGNGRLVWGYKNEGSGCCLESFANESENCFYFSTLKDIYLLGVCFEIFDLHLYQWFWLDGIKLSQKRSDPFKYNSSIRPYVSQVTNY
jgi:hypothetical protein